ncbi:hypothetical protein HDU92_006465 [Lobulomyces angularis]|nr:hypothetical protein HDU92_006465 [Lobulomyces angularis]
MKFEILSALNIYLFQVASTLKKLSEPLPQKKLYVTNPDPVALSYYNRGINFTSSLILNYLPANSNKLILTNTSPYDDVLNNPPLLIEPLVSNFEVINPDLVESESNLFYVRKSIDSALDSAISLNWNEMNDINIEMEKSSTTKMSSFIKLKIGLKKLKSNFKKSK